MVRTSLSALVVASTAVVLATSVTPTRSASPSLPGAPGGAGSPVLAAPAGTPGAGGSARPGSADLAPGERSAGRAPGTGAAAVGPAPVRSVPHATGPSPARARWRWPVLPRPAVARPFRAPRTTYGAGHRGLDLVVADGAPVRAVEGGVVTHAGPVAGRGTVTLSHPGGLSSTYEPVDPRVAVGAVVATGQVVGTLRGGAGPAHCGTRACLHLGARRGSTTYVDPYPLLAGGRVALMPLGD